VIDFEFNQHLTGNRFRGEITLQDDRIDSVRVSRSSQAGSRTNLSMGKPLHEGLAIISRTYFQHSSAFAVLCFQLIENLFEIKISKKIEAARVFMIELERVCCHFSVFAEAGEILMDQMMKAHFSDLEYQSRLILEHAFGSSRFPHESIFCQSGVRPLIQYEKAQRAYLKKIKNEYKKARKHHFDSVSWHLFAKKTGYLKNDLVSNSLGIVARASGKKGDSRLQNELYKDYVFNIPVRQESDVFSRFEILQEEVNESLEIIDQSLEVLSSESSSEKEDLSLLKILLEKQSSTRKRASGEIETAHGPYALELGINSDLLIDDIKVTYMDQTTGVILEKAAQGQPFERLPIIFASLNLPQSEIGA